MENGPFGEDKTIKLFVSKNQQRKKNVVWFRVVAQVKIFKIF